MKLEITDVLPKPPKNGGKREGAGRKTKAFEDKVAATLEEQGDVTYNVARAQKEAWLAKKVELDYRIQKNEYVERAEVRQVCATAFSSLTQTLRSLPDLLERREGVSPEVAERVSTVIDEVLSDLAAEFEMLGGGDSDE